MVRDYISGSILRPNALRLSLSAGYAYVGSVYNNAPTKILCAFPPGLAESQVGCKSIVGPVYFHLNIKQGKYLWG